MNPVSKAALLGCIFLMGSTPLPLPKEVTIRQVLSTRSILKAYPAGKEKGVVLYVVPAKRTRGARPDDLELLVYVSRSGEKPVRLGRQLPQEAATKEITNYIHYMHLHGAMPGDITQGVFYQISPERLEVPDTVVFNLHPFVNGWSGLTVETRDPSKRKPRVRDSAGCKCPPGPCPVVYDCSKMNPDYVGNPQNLINKEYANQQ